ncbi:MAG: shikimate kinase [Bacteroidetes bacterium]|nr:shikimate kinase [Bacteroidota bacterium]MBK9518558.1 shikimate kinase [Anaeromyxobacter sp.]MBL0275421.1 shikimate kinase [Anaeromyxobacter sp.]
MPLGSAEPLALAGMMGAGKSSVAALLGKALGRSVFSTDAFLVARFQKPIPAIFAEDGELAFRRAERELVTALSGPLVVDLGGGAFCDPAASAHLLAHGRVVFLDVSAAEAARRLGAGGGRPLAASWEALHAARLPLYRKAHLTVPVDGRTADEVARAILGAL